MPDAIIKTTISLVKLIEVFLLLVGSYLQLPRTTRLSELGWWAYDELLPALYFLSIKFHYVMVYYLMFSSCSRNLVVF